MTFLSILVVLVLEQLKAAPAARIRQGLDAYGEFLERLFNGGDYRHGVTAWVVGVAIPAALLFGLDLALDAVHPLLSFLLSTAVLYGLMGFRQFSHYFTDIQLALRAGDLDQARHLFHAWTGRECSCLGPSQLVRMTIEEGLLAAYRHVFAPLLWFMLLGPAGALLYRLAVMMQDRSPQQAEGASEQGVNDFGTFSCQALQWLDWLPARLTAITFAIVGDFEDAVYCWRTQAPQWRPLHDSASGILLASGAGALGVRLGQSVPESLAFEERPEIGLGDDVDVDHLQSAIGLVWRALVLCLFMLALLTLASWVGS